jgi:hypothetical protein
VGPRAGLDTEDRGKILLLPPGIELRSPGRPARSQTLYCLSYPGSYSEVEKRQITNTKLLKLNFQTHSNALLKQFVAPDICCTDIQARC